MCSVFYVVSGAVIKTAVSVHHLLLLLWVKGHS